jgi:hypothetical protein
LKDAADEGLVADYERLKNSMYADVPIQKGSIVMAWLQVGGNSFGDAARWGWVPAKVEQIQPSESTGSLFTLSACSIDGIPRKFVKGIEENHTRLARANDHIWIKWALRTNNAHLTHKIDYTSPINYEKYPCNDKKNATELLPTIIPVETRAASFPHHKPFDNDFSLSPHILPQQTDAIDGSPFYLRCDGD